MFMRRAAKITTPLEGKQLKRGQEAFRINRGTGGGNTANPLCSIPIPRASAGIGVEASHDDMTVI
jgi:hypothetical protein